MKIIAFPRKQTGTSASRRLRHAGQTPGIVYGGADIPVDIVLDHNALYHAFKKEDLHSSILELELEGKVEPVLLRDAQLHAYKPIILHVDFQRVDATQKIHVRVPLHFINADISPAVKLAAGIISHVLTDLDISCLPKDLPEFIAVDLAKLEIGHAIHLADIQLPPGVTAVATDNLTLATASAPVTSQSDDTESPAASDGS